MTATLLNTQIATQRLLLKPLVSADAPALFDIFSDPEVMKYWNTKPWPSIEKAESFIASSTQEMISDSTLTLGIYLQETDQLAGKIMLFNYSKTSKRAEIGFGVGREYWGKGIVMEAATALIEFAFNRLQLRRLEAEIDPDNTNSSKALQRLGFVQEGLLKQRWEVDGVVSDSALYGLLAESWSKAKSPSINIG